MVRLPYELHLALRYLRVHRGRTFLSVITLISVAGVTVGTAALVVALALMTGFQEDVRHRILGGSAHLTVLAAGAATFGEVDGLIQRVREAPGVEAAAPVLYTPAMIVNERLDAPAYAELEGVAPELHARVISFGAPQAEPLAALLEPRTTGRARIVLGQELALRLGVREGDPVRVVVPRVTMTPFALLPRSRVFDVSGTFRSDYFQQDAQRAYVALPDARRLLDAPDQASWVELRLVDLRALGTVKESLRKELGHEWSVVDLIEQNQPMLKALNTEKLFLFLAIGLIVIVAALNIVSTLILTVNDKIKDIGTLTAMGARPVAVASIFVLQGLVIGVVGVGVGLSLGSALTVWLDTYRVIGLNPEVYYLSYVPFTLRPGDLTFVAALALSVSLVATLYPAWRAANQDPVEAIRHE